MSQTRKTPPKIMVFHRQTTNDPDWSIGTFVQINALESANMLSADAKSTIGTWISPENTPGWRYGGHSLQPTPQSVDSIVVYYFTWEGRYGFNLIDGPLLDEDRAQRMTLPGQTLIRVKNDGEFTRFARLEDVIEHFAWRDIHEQAEDALKFEVLREKRVHFFEGEFQGSLEEWNLKSRAELVKGAEIKSEEGDAESEEGGVEIKVEESKESEAPVESSTNSVEIVRSSAVKTEAGVSVASAPALQIPSTPQDGMRALRLGRFVRLPGPLPVPLSLQKRKAPESEQELVQRKKKQ